MMYLFHLKNGCVFVPAMHDVCFLLPFFFYMYFFLSHWLRVCMRMMIDLMMLICLFSIACFDIVFPYCGGLCSHTTQREEKTHTHNKYISWKKKSNNCISSRVSGECLVLFLFLWLIKKVCALFPSEYVRAPPFHLCCCTQPCWYFCTL